MLSFFKKKNRLDPAKTTPLNFKPFEIYKMEDGYHVKSAYYVIIQDVGDDFITTYIPEHHSLKIPYDPNKQPPHASMWNYHISRMTLMGTSDDPKIKSLIYNQKNLIPEQDSR